MNPQGLLCDAQENTNYAAAGASKPAAIFGPEAGHAIADDRGTLLGRKWKWSLAMSANRRSIRTILAAAVLGLVVVTTLAFEYRAVAKYIDATQGTMLRSANLGDDLPGLLGNGLTTILW